MSTTNKISARKLAMAIVLVVIMFTSLFFCGFAIKKASAISGSWSDSGNYFTGTITKDSEGYYIVSSPDVFAKCNYYSGTYYKTGTKIRLYANLDMSAHYWVPWDYYGEFDGNGFTISGIKTTSPTSGSNSQYNNCGLFSGLRGATVKNLKLKDFEINGVVCAGALAGYSENSTITNIKVGGTTTIKTENVSSTSMSGNLHTGGICGATKNNSTIEDCWVEGCKIYSSNTLSSAKHNGSYPLSLAGGISGWVDDTGCKIQRCRSLINSIYTYNPDLSTKKMYVTNSYAGGIAGESLGTGGISQCENTSNVYGGVKMDNIAINNTMAGGIAGRAVNCPITACINSGNIYGYSSNSTTADSWETINRIGSCYLYESSSGNKKTAINMEYIRPSGKILYKWVQVTDGRNSASKRALYGTTFFGGIVGYNESSAVTNCYNNGTVSTTNSVCYYEYNYKFVGTMYNATATTVSYELKVFCPTGTYSHSICGYINNAQITNCCTNKNHLAGISEKSLKIEIYGNGSKINWGNYWSSSYNDICFAVQQKNPGQNINIRMKSSSNNNASLGINLLYSAADNKPASYMATIPYFNNIDDTDDTSVGIEISSSKLSSDYYAEDSSIYGGKKPFLKCFYWQYNTEEPS